MTDDFEFLVRQYILLEHLCGEYGPSGSVLDSVPYQYLKDIIPDEEWMRRTEIHAEVCRRRYAKEDT